MKTDSREAEFKGHLFVQTPVPVGAACFCVLSGGHSSDRPRGGWRSGEDTGLDRREVASEAV